MADAESIFGSYAQDAEVTKYLTWQPHRDLATTRAILERGLRWWDEETAFPWVITRNADHALLGMIEMRLDGFRADLGYGLARPYWGHGYATEAVQAVVRWALAQERIYRVWATCDVENLASTAPYARGRTVRQRCG